MPRRPPYEYEPIRDRPFDLPGGENVAVWVVPNIEHYRYDVPYPSDDSSYAPDVSKFSWREYGTRTGVWRLMDVLDRHDVRATVALNAHVCEHEPEIVEAGMARDWEFMGHGTTNSRRLAGLDETEERALVRETRDTIADFTGEPPAGWLSPGRTETFNTPGLLAEAGFSYLCDFVNDDQPYAMDVGEPPLVSMPYSTEINDIGLFTGYACSGPEFQQVLEDQFDVLHAEGAAPGSARVMAISLHPYLTGIPHRSRYLDRALEYITSHDDVWLATGGEIAAHYRETYLEAGSA